MSVRRSLGLGLLVAAGAWIAACDLEPLATPAERGGTAKTLGMFSTELDADLEAQALAALERDAFRREHRFVDAVQPGHLLAATNAPEAEIEAGAWSAEEMFELGAQLFHTTFTPAAGLGGADLPARARAATAAAAAAPTRRSARSATGAAGPPAPATPPTTPTSTATATAPRARSPETPSRSTAPASSRSSPPR